MLENANQDPRSMRIDAANVSDLLLQSFSGHEELSRLFSFDVTVLSSQGNIQASDVVGHAMRISIRNLDGSTRYFHGLANRFAYAGQNDQGVLYNATIVPWLWFLTKRTNCRIFQEKSVPQIIETVFSDIGFTDFDIGQLVADYANREYCVQYRESDFQFVSRLMEEEGIYYFFKHDGERHKLHLADGLSAYFPLPDAEVDFGAPDQSGDLQEQITSWEHHFDFRPGRWTQTDYNPETPKANLMASAPTKLHLENASNYEIYDYPGKHIEPGEGRQRTRVRMEEFEADHDQVFGTSSYPSFEPAGSFSVKSHLSNAEVGKQYVLTRVEYAGGVGNTYKAHLASGESEFTNRFTAIPSDVVFRPRRDTARPVVEGPQTAMIVGPSGEEIFTNENGEVKVQFHWDRYGQYDENSSCWMRVSQVHAGQGWGAMDLPRVGEEVIVDFLEGDPDRPLITGRVYNGEAKPPFELPAGKTRRGNKTKTYMGSGFNEMSMDDTPGAEQLRMNAQHDMDSNVNNNQTLKVGVDRTTEIGNNDTLVVGVDASESVGTNKSTKVGNDMKIDVGNKLNITAGSSITLKCGASRIYMNSGGVITISGTIITTAAAANASVIAPLTQVVGGVMLTTIGGVNMMSGAVCKVGAAGLASVSGGKVDVAASGETAIKGGQITLN